MNDEFDSNFFDDSSKSWRKNKLKRKNGCFLYKCCYISKKKRCCKPIYNNDPNKNNLKYYVNADKFCKKHLNRKYNEKIHIF